jgi:hypothetical protein
LRWVDVDDASVNLRGVAYAKGSPMRSFRGAELFNDKKVKAKMVESGSPLRVTSLWPSRAWMVLMSVPRSGVGEGGWQRNLGRYGADLFDDAGTAYCALIVIGDRLIMLERRNSLW